MARYRAVGEVARVSGAWQFRPATEEDLNPIISGLHAAAIVAARQRTPVWAIERLNMTGVIEDAAFVIARRFVGMLDAPPRIGAGGSGGLRERVDCEGDPWAHARSAAAGAIAIRRLMTATGALLHCRMESDLRIVRLAFSPARPSFIEIENATGIAYFQARGAIVAALARLVDMFRALDAAGS